MSKKKSLLDLSKEYTSYLISSYRKHKQCYVYGTSDPTWEDGMNINLIRNHIIYYKKWVEDNLKDNFLLYPDEYFYPLPAEISGLYMAKQRTCRGLVIRATDDAPDYSEIVKFDWKEAFDNEHDLYTGAN